MGNEINEETNNGKLVSKNFMILTLASISLRAYRGFHDAMEIPLPGQLKNYLIFAPPIINGLLGICDGVSIAKTGKQFTGNYLDSMEGEFKEMVEEPDLPFNKYLYGGIAGGIGEGLTAGLEVLIGYGIGFFGGRIVREMR